MDPNSPNFLEQLRSFLDENPEAEQSLLGESEAELPDDEPYENSSDEEDCEEDLEDDEE